MSESKLIRHVVLPAIAPAALVCLYFTPKATFGCANRGYMAVAVVLLALLGAMATGLKGVIERARGKTEVASWWIVTALILISPLILLAGPLR